MHLRTQLLSLAALAGCSLLADSAAAQATHSYQSLRNAAVSYNVEGCATTRLSIRHSWSYNSSSEDPYGGHVQVSLEYRSSCIPGAAVIQTTSFIAFEPPRYYGDDLESATLSLHGVANDRTCTQVGLFGFNCVRSTKPIHMELSWLASGPLNRSVEVTNAKFEDGTHYIYRQVDLERPAVVTVSGELAGHTFNFESATSLWGYDAWGIQPPVHIPPPELPPEEEPTL